ncbi:helix-turn-helix domain-containing protein [Candidatus Micrarchaeota archaeon]|nr:helix-turn-helix domain-containing protein [Candidatus Micrarchaeota archaeon]MBU1166202.1 helix-turn-helix domain-containing protein [Candidatus Micrarchaeota archaeon]
MGMMRSWRYRLYPSKIHRQQLNNHFHGCKNLWNSLLDHQPAKQAELSAISPAGGLGGLGLREVSSLY